MPATRRIGVLGGTFDPIHFGHLLMAREALRAVELDTVLFAPTGRPSHRDPSAISCARHRCAMVRLALSGERRYALSTLDVMRPKPTFTIDTVRDLRTQYGPIPEFYFIVGADNLVDIPKWSNSAQLVRLTHFVACSRSGYPLRDPGLPPGQLTMLNVPRHDISSTKIRRFVREKRSIFHLTTGSVVRYIRDQQLYEAEAIHQK